ncbi:hypothetical protein H5410_019525 [Solanum commersonii]|uniref:Uncharacterized protein n=1 Tax=Solanum commersonii TaxID=4109 RepID=A0A9J5Z9U6_SOLCO|nr:hypothetical protein H5410_019525 [Solanum commersonii]
MVTLNVINAYGPQMIFIEKTTFLEGSVGQGYERSHRKNPRGYDDKHEDFDFGDRYEGRVCLDFTDVFELS